MDDAQEQDHYEERLKEVFNGFDTSASGSLSPEELSELCQSLHLDDATPALLDALLQDQDRLTARVDFEQFKIALIRVLSSGIDPPPPAEEEEEEEEAEAEAEETVPKPESPEIQPKFVKGSKRYGRRSTPEFLDPISDLSAATHENPAEDEDLEDSYDSAVPRKRERWNAHETSTEEYEAEGQMHLWNPDEPSTPRGSIASLSNRLEERLHEACDELGILWDGDAAHTDLLALCDYVGLEINADLIQSLNGDGMASVQEFVSRVVNHNKPPTPSASTPYRQLKRLHSTQPFDEGGRRIATPSVITSTIGMRLFSTLDDGTGYTPVEYILDAWMEEGIENSTEILQALNFDLDGKLSLSDLTMALENELLVTRNGIHQAALASFKAEIRYLLERVDRELREKEKIRSDLEKAEKLKSQLATEVDEHHSSIEQTNNQNLRKLEQEHKEKLAAVRSELMKEMDQIQQQSVVQREELEAEIEKIREDESFLRDHLSISVKENRRLEMELLDNTEKLVEAESLVAKLQTNLDNILKNKFGDLDPGSADFFIQEERIKQLRSGYEAQCRELQDRIDELQSELQEFHSIGRTHPLCNKPLLEELEETTSPGMESDPGIGSEEVHPFSMSLEAEMMLEQLKDQHLQEMEDLRTQLESKINEFDKMVGKQRISHEEQKAALALQYQQEALALREEITNAQTYAQELQSQLEQAALERTGLEHNQAAAREELQNLQEEEVASLRKQLLEARTNTADLEEQLKTLEEKQAMIDANLTAGMEELREQHSAEKEMLRDEHLAAMEELRLQHACEMNKLEEENMEQMEAKLEEEKKRLQEEKEKLEKGLLDDFESERERLKQSHEQELKARLEEVNLMFEGERSEILQKLTEQWQKERAQMDEQNSETLQVVLEEEMLRLTKEHEEKESQLREQWESEHVQLQEQALLSRLQEERQQLQEQYEQREKRLQQEWEKEKLQLEEDYEGMLQDRLSEEREKLEMEKEEQEKRLERSLAEEKALLEDSHREAMQELTVKHSEERNLLSSMLDKLRDDVAQERSVATRLAEENLILQQKIDVLKEEDLKGAQNELMLTLDHLKNEKISAQTAAESFSKQICELRLQSQHLEDGNPALSGKNSQNIADMVKLRQHLAELITESERRTASPTDGKNKLAACVSSLEVELNKALEETSQLEQRNAQLSEQLSGLREKAAKSDSVESQFSHLMEERNDAERETQGLRHQLTKAQERAKAVDETLQAVNHQSASLRADLRVLQQERDSLKHEVAVLQKQLQNATDKNHVLEKALHSGGIQHQSKKLHRDEKPRMKEQEHLAPSREKVRALDAPILPRKQPKHQSQFSLLKALEQENASLKQELEAQKEVNKIREAGQANVDMESLQQENEALKAQMARLSAQVIETFQAQFMGLLPPSPHRIPRGQHRAEDPDVQDEREKKMKNMEERLREIEMSLHNVKLLLKEKVAQLQNQLHKNGKADVLIKDLYVENSHLLQALEVTEQRHKIAEKKNYLLEEKISSLNKIVRDLNPSPLVSPSHHYKCP